METPVCGEGKLTMYECFHCGIRGHELVVDIGSIEYLYLSGGTDYDD